VVDDFLTFRDHFLSIYQSAVSEVARRIDAERVSDPKKVPRRSISRSASSLLPGYAAEIARREHEQNQGRLTYHPPVRPRQRALTPRDAARTCAELALRYFKASLSGDNKELAEINGEFEAGTCDPAWASTIQEYLQYFGPGGSRNRIPYKRASVAGPTVIEFKADARIAIVGDWGTGAQPAIRVLKQIADHKPDILIHLGDIYYSGTPTECDTNFASIINSVLRRDNLQVAVYVLAGNHDMYCGGVGYYDLIQRLNPEIYLQPASFFCLRSADERWQLLAMDTGLHDYSPLKVNEAVTFIEDGELEWHCERLKEFPGRTILLSHHQLFSAFSPIGGADQDGNRSASNPHLLKAFKSMAASGRISAWFWGHEHTLSIYNPFAGLERGRCLGHGAVPVSVRDQIYTPVGGLLTTPTIVANTKLQKQGGVYAHGYAILGFGDACSVTYYQDVGGRSESMYSEVFD
jgi:Calcineurin-like phosphoesterase